MNVEKAAKALGVSGARVRQMLIGGKLSGKKKNRDWEITPAAVAKRRKDARTLRKKFSPNPKPNHAKPAGRGRYKGTVAT